MGIATDSDIHGSDGGPDDDDDSDGDGEGGEDKDEPRSLTRYGPDEMLALMKFQRLFRNPYKAAEALVAAAHILEPGNEAETFEEEIASKTRRLPHRTSVDRAFLRSDLLLMLWRREHVLVDGKRIARFLTIDASPQGGFDYLIAHEVLMIWDELEPVKLGFHLEGFEWEKRLMPVTCMGAKETNTTNKTCKLAHSGALESGYNFTPWRQQVSGQLTDQGSAERGVAKAPLLIKGDTNVRGAIGKLERGEVNFGDPALREHFFLPNAIEHIGHKHTIFNALKECVVEQEAKKLEQ